MNKTMPILVQYYWLKTKAFNNPGKMVFENIVGKGELTDNYHVSYYNISFPSSFKDKYYHIKNMNGGL